MLATPCKKLLCIKLFIILAILLEMVLPISSFSKETSRSLYPDTLNIFWNESKPFVFKSDNDKMRGIEVEIMELFVAFLEKEKKNRITLNWIEEKNFESVLKAVCNSKKLNALGASAISITNERKNKFDFGKPYMNDISVLICNSDVPKINSEKEFDKISKNLKAITIKGTTYETDLIELKLKRGIDFETFIISSNENILKNVEKTKSSFGFIDLPIYLMYFNQNPSIKIQRLNLFAKKREGYSIIFSKNNPWKKFYDEFMNSNFLNNEIDKITNKYFNLTLYKFIDSLAIETKEYENYLLTKEKEIQTNNINLKEVLIKEQKTIKSYLILFLSILSLLCLVIFFLFRKTKKNHLNLSIQKQKIEQQQIDIEEQNVQLEKRNSRLLVLNEEKNSLIKILAHDLRTPLNQISGLAKLLSMDQKILDDEGKEMIELIKGSSERLSKMINTILDIDAIESGKSKTFLEKLELTSLMKFIIKNFSLQAKEKNIELKFSSNREQIFVNADYLMLLEVIENLISNALKFSNKNSSVDISVSENLSGVLISIKDYGQGLNTDELQLLFVKFQTLSSKPTNGESSTGLGLSIVKKYVSEMDGTVWCVSEKGKGSTFFVSFNLYQA